ncbi:TetR/AcrR family transcriptional regulator [Paenibacillus yanchengensis]|uniref:TetR/AcrR family transcriptional regulator n=1 Tax=Paenibacillus yanchengensis TaxID=2035833 RepID=A0ABW4YQR4_9BACL
MPPKVEVTRDKILDAAFSLVREQGQEVLTARNIAKGLNCSTQPIYSAYENMDALKDELYDYALDYTVAVINAYEDSRNPNAINLINGILLLARNEKHLFRLVFLTEQKNYFLKDGTNKLKSVLFAAFLQSDTRLAKLEQAKLERIFLKLSIYVTGIGTMININTLKLDFVETKQLVIEMFEHLLASENIQI